MASNRNNIESIDSPLNRNERRERQKDDQNAVPSAHMKLGKKNVKKPDRLEIKEARTRQGGGYLEARLSP